MYTFRGSNTNTKTNTNTHSEDQIQIQTQIDKTRDILRDFRKGYGRGINLSEQCIYLRKSKHLVIVVYNGQICYEIIWADCTINDNYSETCIL